MLKAHYQKALVIASVLMLLVNGAFAARRGPRTFNQVRQIQERHNQTLLGKNGVVGTAVCRDGRGGLAVSVFTERRGIRGIPSQLDGANSDIYCGQGLCLEIAEETLALEQKPRQNPTGGP